jgi:hypothetical protein
LLDLQRYWRREGTRILEVVGEKYPELIFTSMVKLARVMRVEVGGPGDLAKLGSKEAILEKLELSTPEQKCIGWPEQKYISDASRKAHETRVFCSGIRLGSDYLPAYPS